MSDFSVAAVGLFAVIATPGAIPSLAASSAAGRPRMLIGIVCVLFGVLAAITVLSDAVLDWLDVSAENFQLAAGIVMLPLALKLLWSGQRGSAPASVPLWRGWSLLLGPVPVVVVLSYGGRFGRELTLEAGALAAVVSAAFLFLSPWFLARLGSRGCSMLGRLNGALIVVMAVELMVDWLESV